MMIDFLYETTMYGKKMKHHNHNHNHNIKVIILLSK